MIKIFWNKKRGYSRNIAVELQHEVSQWDLTDDQDMDMIKGRVKSRICEEIATKIAEEIEYTYSDEIKDMIAEEMLADKDIKKMVKQSFVDHAKRLLYG